MKLLICTQKVDLNDSVLGFFHAWISAFAKKWDHITVICLEKGDVSLPENVKVKSLGKENMVNVTPLSKLKYSYRFYRLLYDIRGSYDTVFVHMNPEYVLLAGVLWRLFGKKVFLWYNHHAGGIAVRLSALISHRILHTSPYAFPARLKNAVSMPAGIDTDLFHREKSRSLEENTILYLGRIAPIKGVHTLLQAARILHDRGVAFSLSVYGDAVTQDETYYSQIKNDARDLIKSGILTFHSGIPNRETPPVYNKNTLFINLSPSGLYDKTVLEAMACGCIVLASSEAFKDILPEPFLFREGDENDLAQKIIGTFALQEKERTSLNVSFRTYVENTHGLEKLTRRLYELYKL